MADLRVPDLNKVLIAGRLTRDPELRYTSNNMAYCKLGMANTRHYKGKDGNRNEETLFIDVTVWGQMAEWVGEKLKKGRAVLVEGRLRSSEWDDKETGQRRTRMEINAERVVPLEWDGDQGQREPKVLPHVTNDRVPAPPAVRPRAIEEPIPEDQDTPF